MAITHKFVLNTVAPGKPVNVPRLVMLRITSQRVIKFVDTSVYVKPDQFNEAGEAQKKNWVRRTHPQHEVLNTTLLVWHDRVAHLVQRLTQVGGTYTAQQVKDRLLGRQDESFSGYVEDRIQHWIDNGQEDNAINNKAMLNRLREFLHGYKPLRQPAKATQPANLVLLPPKIELNQLTPAVVTAFEDWLQHRTQIGSRKKSTAGTRRNCASDRLRRLRQHIKGYIIKHNLPSELDPTRGMKFSTVITDQVWMTQAELATWEEARLNLPVEQSRKGRNTLEAARVFFLSSYYLHGIRAGDLLSLKAKQLEQQWEMLNGKPVSTTRLRYTSDKKDKTKLVLVEPIVLAMLQPYLKDKNPDDFIFPFLPPEVRFVPEDKLGPFLDKRVGYMNVLLKKIAAELGTNVNVTMHSARRSFADQLYEMTGDLRMVQDALHHSNILTTQRYIQQGKQHRVDQANQVYRRQRTETRLKHTPEDNGKEPDDLNRQMA